MEALQAAGVDQGDLAREVDLILQHATGYAKAQQILKEDEPLSEAALLQLEEIQQRRAKREPLQYCLGEQWFMGLRFAVRQGVLIPRADTETLVETAIARLSKLDNPTFLDVGTGSGAIAISILKALPKSRGWAIDISDKAKSIAEENAEYHHVSDRLKLQLCSWQTFTPEMRFDALLSNPPYIAPDKAGELAPEVSLFEPKEALFGLDADGLGFYRDLAGAAQQVLQIGGFIVMEVGQGQAEQVRQLLIQANWTDVDGHLDLNRVTRCISATRAD